MKEKKIKDCIYKLLKQKETFYPSEVANLLKISYEEVLEVVNKMKKSRELESAGV